jgi:glyoxylase-like metal-dependent hydrolase (beta-lactamase superfamily II)
MLFAGSEAGISGTLVVLTSDPAFIPIAKARGLQSESMIKEATMPDTTTLHIGAARVAILNAGDMRLLLKAELAVPEALWRPQYADLFERPDVSPSLSIYVEQHDTRVLVDINDYRATVTPGSEYALPGYTPPPPIPDQLRSLGVQPADITHVVITHPHWDHFAGTTSPGADGYVPTFPHARHYLGAADWMDAELQAALQDPASLEARTFGVLHRQGMLRLVGEQESIAEGIDILPAPGETPGHQIVRLRSGGETLYIVGDVFHHPIEVKHPDWMVGWADAETMRVTRQWLLQVALADHALLIASHIAGLGRIERTDDGPRWASASA